MSNDKNIDYGSTVKELNIHRLIGRMPDLHRAYGFWIINASIACHSAGDGFYSCGLRKFEFYSLSHLFDGAGKVWIEGKGECEITPGQAVLISPGTLNRYGGAAHQPYIEDSIRFCGPVADMLRASGVLADGVYDFGSVRRLLPIAEQIQDPSGDAQISANISLQKLLVDLYLEHRKRSSATPMEELLEAVKSRPEHWWTVEEMAEFCNLSGDQLRRNFRRHTGMLPKAYIEEFKLRQAAEFLISTLLPVNEIAAKLGYLDAYHFSRRFKLFSGISPERYRRESPGARKP